MPSPTMVEELLEHFPRGADPPAINQRASPLPVRFPTSLSLWEISLDRDGSRGAQGGASGCRSPRDGGSGAGGRNKDNREDMNSEAGAASRTTVVTVTKAAPESGRKRATKDLPVKNSNN